MSPSRVAGALLFPGAGMGAAVYQRLARRMPGLVVASRRPEPGCAPTPLRAAVAEALRAADRAGGPVLLLGHSMGGFAAEAAARLHPGAVAAVVLLDPSVGESRAYAAPTATTAPTTAPASTPVADAAPSDVPPPGTSVRDPLGPAGAPAARRAARCVLPGGRLVGDLRSYEPWAQELARVRAHAPLPDVPIVVLSAAWTATLPWDRRWLAQQRGLVDRLRRDHPRGDAGVAATVVIPCGHAVMWWRPDSVLASLPSPGAR